MINMFKLLFLKLKKTCPHTNRRYRKWLCKKTPMIESECRDCGKTLDYGHVYGGSKDWATNGWVNYIKN